MNAADVVLLVVVAVALGVGATLLPTRSEAASVATCGKLLAPDNGIYFGAAPDFVANPRRLEGDTVTAQAIDQFERQAGRKTIWAEFAQHWFMGLEFPRDKVMTVWRHGQIPYVRMMPHAGSPYGVGNPPEQYPGDYSMQNIIDGRFDLQLRAWARSARELDIPLLVEFGTEVNTTWGPWAGEWNGGGTTDGYGDPSFPDGPERFRDAYRRLVTLFREEGATNVTWFFHVVLWYRPPNSWNSFANYYPGDDYVDWLGLSVYGLPNLPDGSYMSFEQGLQTFRADDYAGNYADLAALSSKPIAIPELGITEVPVKPQWIRDAFATLASGRYPRIKAIAWWNSTDVNTRIDSSPASEQAFREAAQSPVFDVKPQLSGNCLPKQPTRLSARRSGRTVRLTWAAVANATSYEIWRSGRRVGTAVSPTFSDRRKVRASYRVRAVNPLGVGPLSAAVVR